MYNLEDAGTCGGQKRVLGYLQLLLQMLINYQVAAGNRIQVVWQEQPVFLISKPSLLIVWCFYFSKGFLVYLLVDSMLLHS